MIESNDEELDKFNEYISEKELHELFEFQYDDLFCKILKISEKSFIYFLKQQILFNLKIIKRKASSEIISAYLNLFIKRYKENFKLVKKNYEIIKEKEKEDENNLRYLDITKCYIHCHKCFNIIHKCGKKLVIYDDYIYCTKCINVYNKNQILAYCPECKKNYLSKLRKPVFNENKTYEKLFLVKFKKYHCHTDKEEKIKCLKCSNNLYFRLSQHNLKNENKINIIYCIKCKLKYNINEVFFKCKICLKYFKGEAKLYRDFSFKKKKLLFLIHTLLRNKNSLPNFKLFTKTCGCEYNKKEIEYFHNEDKGKFLEGIKNNKISVVCGKCFKIFKYNEVNWNCPKCGKEFISKNKNSNININQSDNNSTELGEEIDDLKELRKIPVFKVNLSKNNNNENKSLHDKENGAKKDEIKTKNENNNIKTIVNKKLDKKFIINFGSNKKNSKNSFINKNELNKVIIKTKNLLRKSRSKNDIIMRKNKNVNKINGKHNKNKIISNMNKQKEIQNHENNKKDEFHQKEENINEQIISKEKENNKKEKEERKEANDEKKEEKEKTNEGIEEKKKIIEEKKEEIKDIDTREIFNKIKDNIYNEEESFYFLSPKIEKKINSKKILNNEKKEKILIKPRHKNTQYLGNNEFNINNIYDDKSFYGSEELLNNELIEEPKRNNIYYQSNKKIQSTGNFNNLDNVNIENSDKKHIKYTKKIYFYNEKNDKIINSNKNKPKPNNLFIKHIRNNYFNGNEEFNLYENKNEIPYLIDESFQNFDNYYIDYQNYKDYPSFNLYNFSSDNYSTVRLLGKGASGKIYLVIDMLTNQNFALKTILIDNEFQLKCKEEEYNLIYKLTYENPELKIISIFGLEIRRIDKFNIFFNVLMEAAICDWEMEIISRKKRNKYYTEEELLYILNNLVGTLAYLQQKNISHRDLKPQNILYFGNNEYKICDFGEAKLNEDKQYKIKEKESNFNFDDSKQTIRGTELYMSPILFKAVKFKPNSLTTYNSFKSDVFSLGLCFLNASCLDTTIIYKIREILDMQKIINIVNDYLSNRYSQNYINLLLYMIQIDEKYRPDFIELNSWLLYGNN